MAAILDGKPLSSTPEGEKFMFLEQHEHERRKHITRCHKGVIHDTSGTQFETGYESPQLFHECDESLI